MFIFLYSWFT